MKKNRFKHTIFFCGLFLVLLFKSNCLIAQNNYKFSADSLPCFYGGKEQLDLFIKSNLNWPSSEVDVDGTVILSCIIDTNGFISDVKIERGLFNVFDNEAIRVVKLMPKWKPAIAFGVKVRALVYIPITFKIEK